MQQSCKGPGGTVSLMEVLYLAERGYVNVVGEDGAVVTQHALEQHVLAVVPDHCYVVFAALRDKGRVTEGYNVLLQDGIVYHPMEGNGAVPIALLAGDMCSGAVPSASWVADGEGEEGGKKKTVVLGVESNDDTAPRQMAAVCTPARTVLFYEVSPAVLPTSLPS